MSRDRLWPWIVPKLKTVKFIKRAYTDDTHFGVNSVAPYDNSNFLVLTFGSYPYLENILEGLLEGEIQ